MLWSLIPVEIGARARVRELSTYARAAATALEEGGCDGMVRFIAALAGYGEAGALGARDRDEATIA